ncbi:hypothetical protein [Paenibacillus foliorum]|uniref:hypothetical protein n=1 Tax=Paenibacillus foliorum TaxID=2654974 RepID=UPI0035E3F7C9
MGRGRWRAAPEHSSAGADISAASTREAPSRSMDGRGGLARFHRLANGRHAV